MGVRNDPRRLVRYVAASFLQIAALAALFAFAVCAIARGTGSHAGTLAFALAWMAGMVPLLFRMAKRVPMVVLRVSADGTNGAARLLIGAQLLPLAIAAALFRQPLLVPLVVLTVIVLALVWRGRGRVPEVLGEFRTRLAADESVQGDGVGVAQGARSWDKGFRLVAATDRRLLVAGSPRSTEPFLLIDAAYRRISRFGIDWKLWGRVGVLSLTVDGETHVISSIAPANLLSIARALQAHGVPPDDRSAVSDAERGWEEALRRGPARRRRFDRGAMRTREFDQGLWLLLGLSAVAFYLNPFGIGLGPSRDLVIAVFVIAPIIGGICGYVSRTKASLAYIAPLDLVLSPAFFFADAGDVIIVMLLVDAAAAIGLWTGAALRDGAPSQPMRAARGSLRYTLSGTGLIRLSSVMLAAVLVLAASAGAAGFGLMSLRMAVDEVIGHQLPVDGRSNLTGRAASLRYTPGPKLHEIVTDEHYDAGPNDGARWELRSSFTQGYNVVSLAHYIFEPHLDNRAAVAKFVAGKDDEHAKLAGFRVRHTQRVVDGRKGYVWNHGSRRGYWFYAAWFPQPIHTVRIECIARRQKDRFKRLCAEAVRSLKFRR